MSRRESSYGKWSTESMERALSAVRNSDMSLRTACCSYGVPKTTLKRHLNGTNKYAKEGRKHFGHPVDLSEETENELVSHVLMLEEMLFGMSAVEVRKLAFEIAEANRYPHSFNRNKQMAGKKWFYAFLKRHKEISLRQPEPTSIARATAFNKEWVYSYFDLYEGIISREKILPTRIFNMDETGLTSVQKPQKVIAKKGKHQVGGIVSGERGETTTCVCCVSAAGYYVPPLLIFKRKRMVDNIKDGAPTGSVFACQETGWMNSSIFCQWLQHFIDSVRPTAENKVLLLLDGHVSHTKNLKAVTMARENGVIMLSFPPHTTHRLQPLDLSFFGPLNTSYNQTVDIWMRTYPGRPVTQYQVSRLFGEAYTKVATVANAESGFKGSGLWPSNRHIFPEYLFAPSSVTDTHSLRPTVASAIQQDNVGLVPTNSQQSESTSNLLLAVELTTHPDGPRTVTLEVKQSVTPVESVGELTGRLQCDIDLLPDNQDVSSSLTS